MNMYKIEIEFTNEDDKGTIILQSGGVQINDIVLSNEKEGMLLVGIMRNLTKWMKKNIVKTIEIREE